MQQLPDIPPEILRFFSSREQQCYKLLKEGMKQEAIGAKLYFKDHSGVSRMRNRIIVRAKLLTLVLWIDK